MTERRKDRTFSFRLGRLLFYASNDCHFLIGAKMYGIVFSRESMVGIVYDDSWYAGEKSLALICGRYSIGVFLDPEGKRCATPTK